jgi:hypothetical protein
MVSRTAADDNADDLSTSSVLNRLAAGGWFRELGGVAGCPTLRDFGRVGGLDSLLPKS